MFPQANGLIETSSKGKSSISTTSRSWLYRCPHRTTEVEFFSGYFDLGARQAKVDAHWRSQFDVARPLVAFEEAFEFYCPGCNAPLRIVYENKYNRSGGVDTDLLSVLEITQWPVARGEP